MTPQECLDKNATDIQAIGRMLKSDALNAIEEYAEYKTQKLDQELLKTRLLLKHQFYTSQLSNFSNIDDEAYRAVDRYWYHYCSINKI